MKLKTLGKSLKTRAKDKLRHKKKKNGGRSADSELLNEHLGIMSTEEEESMAVEENAEANEQTPQEPIEGRDSEAGEASDNDNDDAANTKSADGGETGEESETTSQDEGGMADNKDNANDNVDTGNDAVSISTHDRLTQSISQVLLEEDIEAAKSSSSKKATRDETESSGRPPRGHSKSLSRTSAPSTGSGGTGSSPNRDRTATANSIKSRDRSMGSIEIRGSRSLDGSVFKEKKDEHGSKMVFEFDENGIQAVDLTKLSSSHDSDDTDRCPTVIMDDQNIEIVNSLSDSSVSNDHKTKKKGSAAAAAAELAAAAAVGHMVMAPDHIVLVVSSINRSVKFYALLGFERIERPVHLKEQTSSCETEEAWVSDGKITLYLVKGELSDDQSTDKPAICLYAPKAREVIMMLRKTNVPFIVNPERVVGSGIDKRFQRQAFIRDPDGNYIELSNLKTSSSVIKVDATGESQESKTVVVGNIIRRLLSNADLRPSFDDEEVGTATTLVQSLSDTDMTSAPSSLLNLVAKNTSQQRLKPSRSTSYLDVAKKSTSSINIDQLKSFDSSEAPTLSDLIESINHISLVVSDVKKTLKFYTKVLELQQVIVPSLSQNGEIASVVAGDVVINLVQGEPFLAQNPLEGRVFLNVSGISHTFKELQEKRIPYRVSFARDAAESSDSGTLVEAYVTDPDGYPIALGNYVQAARTESAAAAAKNTTTKDKDSEVKPIPRQYQPAVADPEILRNFARRRKFEGDICYQFTRNDLKNILRQAGNDAPTAMLLMKQRREKEAAKRAAKKKRRDVTDDDMSATTTGTSTGMLCCAGCCYNPCN